MMNHTLTLKKARHGVPVNKSIFINVISSSSPRANPVVLRGKRVGDPGNMTYYTYIDSRLRGNDECFMFSEVWFLVSEILFRYCLTFVRLLFLHIPLLSFHRFNYFVCFPYFHFFINKSCITFLLSRINGFSTHTPQAIYSSTLVSW